MMSNSSSHSQTATPLFSQTQAFTLPVECWYLVNDTSVTKSEMKVTLCVLLNHFSVGIEAAMLSFSDILEQTGLSKASVAAGLEAALARGSVFRREVNSQIVYEPGLEKSEPMTCHESCHDGPQILNLKSKDTTCHGSEIEPRQNILQQLLEFGLASHVAHNIAMTNRYKLELLETQIDYVAFEHENGLLPKRQSAIPGYIVNRIKYNRIEPQGYAANGNAWYTAEESRLMQR